MEQAPAEEGNGPGKARAEPLDCRLDRGRIREKPDKRRSATGHQRRCCPHPAQLSPQLSKDGVLAEDDFFEVVHTIPSPDLARLTHRKRPRQGL